MSPARRWNLADFATVLDAPAATPTELVSRVPGRRQTEVVELRQAVHAYHSPYAERPTPRVQLTEPMCRYLSRRRGEFVCALCGVGF